MIYWIVGGVVIALVSYVIGRMVDCGCVVPTLPIPESVTQTTHDRLHELEEEVKRLAPYGIFSNVVLEIGEKGVKIQSGGRPQEGNKWKMTSVKELLEKIIASCFEVEIVPYNESELKLKVKK